jgi:hypothetical protein
VACIPDQIQKVTYSFHGRAVVGEIAVMEARRGIILSEAIYDLAVHVQANIHMIAILNDKKPFFDRRLVAFITALEGFQDFGISKKKIVDTVRYLYFIDPLELTLQCCEHPARLPYASMPKAACRDG